ncbi:MAG: PAS domain-containing sensor histidine kinase [Candidatus Saccharimonadales bacterium]
MWLRKKSKAAEAKSDGRLTSDFILEAIEDGVVVVGSRGEIELYNRAATKISGWPAAEAIGLDYRSVLPMLDEKGQPKPAGNHPFAQVFAQGKVVRDPNGLLSTRSSKQLPISMIASPLAGSGGQGVAKVIGVFRDVSKEKADEARRSEFISTASHEMRTPLAAIEGYLSLALNEKIAKVDSNARKYVEKASAATKHLGILFADLLTSSRAEDGRLVSYPTVIEIGETIAQVVEAERFRAKERGLELNYLVSSDKDVAGGLVVRPTYYVFADPHRIAEVLQNLIDNAIKYTSTGAISVRLTGNSSVAQIQVSDTGAGIPAEDIPHLFQKFYRVDNTATRTVGGTGLGLFICRKIIELYNGKIWVESQLGKGSTFFINLPRLTSEQALNMQRKKASIISPMEP